VVWHDREGWVATGWVSNRDRDRAIKTKVIVVAYDERDEPVARRPLPPITLDPNGEQFFRTALLLMQGDAVPIRAEPVVTSFDYAPPSAGARRDRE
jgi:hypothetical protein